MFSRLYALCAALLVVLISSSSPAFAQLFYNPRNVSASDSQFTDRIRVRWELGPEVCETWAGCNIQYYIYASINDSVDCTTNNNQTKITGPYNNVGIGQQLTSPQSHDWSGSNIIPGIRYKFAVGAEAPWLPSTCSIDASGPVDYGSRAIYGAAATPTATTNNPNYIVVSWGDPYFSDWGVNRWQLFTSTDPGSLCSGTPSYTTPNRATRTFNDTNYFNRPYYYSVRAIDNTNTPGPCSAGYATGYRPGQAPSVSAIQVSPATVVNAGTAMNLSVSATGAIPYNTVAYAWSAAGSPLGIYQPSLSFVAQAGQGTRQYDVAVTHPESNFSTTRSISITVCRADMQVVNGACACAGQLQDIGGACQCPAGAHQSGTNCITCSGGTQWNGSACVCRADQQLVNGVCTCPGQLQDIGGACQCPSGTNQSGTNCITCSGGTQWNGSACVCPGQLQLIGGICACAAPYIQQGTSCVLPQYSISGSLGTTGVTLGQQGSATCSVSGNSFNCQNIAHGSNLTLNPSKAGFNFVPASQTFLNVTSNQTFNFTANQDLSAPAITTQPSNQSVIEGQSVTFAVTVSGNPTPVFQWFRDGQNPVGGNAAQYSFIAGLNDNGARFKVRASNSEGSVDSQEVNLTVTAAPRAVRPIAECVMAMGDGTLAAYFGYESQNNAVISIAPGTNDASSANLISGGTILAGTQQPADFQAGRVRGTFAVVFPAGAGASFTLGYGGTGIQTATANAQTPACANVNPHMNCVTAIASGGFKARFSYDNQNAFDIHIPSGPSNRFSPAPEFRDQPVTFLAALGQSPQIDVTSSSGEPLTWTLGSQSVTAGSDSTPCSLPPICNAGGPYKVGLGVTQLALSAQASYDPESEALSYAWSTTCADSHLTNSLSAAPILAVAGNRADCSVTLAVSDSTSVVLCDAQISFELEPVCRPDRCGVNCGDGMSCCNCVEVNVTPSLLALSSSTADMAATISRYADKLVTLAAKSSDPRLVKVRKLARKTLPLVDKAKASMLGTLGQLPPMMTDCASQFAVRASNLGILSSVSSNTQELAKYYNGLIKAAKRAKLPRSSRTTRRIKAFSEAVKYSISLIPQADSTCPKP
jgi:hypothetical protein